LLARIKAYLDRFRGRDKVVRSYVPWWRIGLPDFADPLEEQYLRLYVGDVYSCVSLRADAVATTNLGLYSTQGKSTIAPARAIKSANASYLAKQSSLRPWLRKAATMDDVVEIVEHPLLDLFKRVNPWHNQFEFFECLSIYLDLLGKCHVFMARDELGRVVELWPLPPDKIRGVYSRETLIDHWIYRPGDEDIRYETDEILYHRMFSPIDMLQGWSPLRGCIKAADLSNRMLDYERALLKNAAVPDILVFGEQRIPADVEKRFREDWKKRHGGDQVGGVGMLGGVKDVKHLGMTPKEMGHDKGLEAVRDRICNAFRVPKSLLTSDDVNRANADAGLTQFARWAISPRHRKLEQWLNQDLIPLFDTTGTLFLAFDNTIPEDREVRMLEIEKHIASGYTSPNEERAKDGLPPREGGDEYRDPPDPADFASPVGAAGNGGSSNGNGSNGGKRVVRVVRKVQDGPGEDPKARGLQTEMSRYFAMQEQEVLNRTLLIEQPGPEMRSDEGNGDGNGDGLTRGACGTANAAILTKDRTSEMIERLLFVSQVWDQVLSDRAVPYIRSMLMEGAEGGSMQLAELDVAFDLTQSEALEFLEGRVVRFSGKFAKRVNATTRQALTDQLKEAISAGENLDEIRGRIKAVYSQAKTDRAQTIARSETKRALEAGRRASYQAAGVEKMEWVADPNACEFCRPFHGKIIATKGESFLKNGDSVQGDEGGTYKNTFEDVRHPPLHPRCTCFLVPVVE